MIKCFFAILNSISLIFIILLTSIELPTFNYGFYSYQYKKNNTFEIIGISAYDLEKVTIKLMDYMKDKEDNLEVYANINGQNREFFNDIEKLHMIDVKNLFQIGYVVREIALIMFFITFLMAFVFRKRPALKTYAVSYISCSIILILIFAIFMLMALNDFDTYFTIFHEIFFDNDLWILDPSRDLLINIVPLNFFIDIFKLTSILFLFMTLIMTVLCVAYLKNISNNQEVRAI